MLVNTKSVSWYFSINLSHMFVLADGGSTDGKQVKLLCATFKDLMGYKRQSGLRGMFPRIWWDS